MQQLHKVPVNLCGCMPQQSTKADVSMPLCVSGRQDGQPGVKLLLLLVNHSQDTEVQLHSLETENISASHKCSHFTMPSLLR